MGDQCQSELFMMPFSMDQLTCMTAYRTATHLLIDDHWHLCRLTARGTAELEIWPPCWSLERISSVLHLDRDHAGQL